MKAIGSYINSFLKGFFGFIMGVMSENGSPSSTRFLMILFSFATVRIMFLIVRHLISIHDIGLLGIWLGNLPVIIASLIGLISTPYAINRGANSLSSIAGLMNNVKSGKNDAVPVDPPQPQVVVQNNVGTV